jgi:hypothetical protein
MVNFTLSPEILSSESMYIKILSSESIVKEKGEIMKMFFLVAIAAIATPASAGVTVCKDAKGRKTYTEYRDCSALGLTNERTLNHIRTQPAHCDGLEANAKALNDLANDHGPNGKTQHIASSAVANMARRQAKSIETKYENECVRK